MESASAGTVNSTDIGSRDIRRGAGGGRARMDRACWRIRGSTQPISEMNSSRYTAANHGEA